MNETTQITCDQFLSQPPEAVWRALTEPDLIARWWAPGDVRPIVGHTFTLDMGQWGSQRCTVLAVETGRLISYTFGEGSLDTTITWELVAEGTGTRLFLRQDGFDLNSPIGQRAFDGMGGGWPNVLRKMEGFLASA